MIDLIADSDRVCPHFHLPLQSGDDYILKRMDRKYDAAQYLETVERIRGRLELPSISTELQEDINNKIPVQYKNCFIKL